MKISKLQRYIALLASAAIVVAAYFLAPAGVPQVLTIVGFIVNNILQDKAPE